MPFELVLALNLCIALFPSMSLNDQGLDCYKDEVQE